MEYSETEIKKLLSEHFPKVDGKDILIHLNDNSQSQPSCSKKQDYSHLTMDEIVQHMMEKYVSMDFFEHVEKFCELENIDFNYLSDMIRKKHSLKLEELCKKMALDESPTQKEENIKFDCDTEPKNLWETSCSIYENAIGKKDHKTAHHKTATACRLILNQIDFQKSRKQLSPEAANKLKERCLLHYSSIVDDVSEGGLNNYLKEIQSKQSQFLKNLCAAPASEPQWDKWESKLNEISNEELSTYICTDLIKDIDKELACLPRQKEDNDIEALKNEMKKLVCDKIDAALANCSSEILNKAFGKDASLFTEDLESKQRDTSRGEKSTPIAVPVFSAPKRKVFIDQKQNSYASPNAFSYENQVITEKQRKSAVKRKQESPDFVSDEPSINKQPTRSVPSFKTATDVLATQKNDKASNNGRKCLGSRRSVHSKFKTPIFQQDDDTDHEKPQQDEKNDVHDERLKGIDPKMVEVMMNEIMDHDSPITWDDIAGLEFVKTTLKEIVVWPLLRPDLFTGLRGPPKGILLFGPPGTGKTLIGKCVASQSKSTFFSISASSLGSKWYGEGEKLVRALFTVARCYQPAVIFIDEIDSLLTQRSDNDHESSRRVKTEFLVQLDGVKTVGEERLLIIGATNRPQELDEAARRRLVKRLYIPLPEPCARIQIVKTLLANHNHELSEDDMNALKEKTEGYSGADMANLCKEAALGPIRSIDLESIASVTSDDVRPIKMIDFIKALNQVRASVSDADLNLYEDWNKRYGSSFS